MKNNVLKSGLVSILFIITFILFLVIDKIELSLICLLLLIVSIIVLIRNILLINNITK